jgi:hypothetical protein
VPILHAQRRVWSLEHAGLLFASKGHLQHVGLLFSSRSMPQGRVPLSGKAQSPNIATMFQARRTLNEFIANDKRLWSTWRRRRGTFGARVAKRMGFL